MLSVQNSVTVCTRFNYAIESLLYSLEVTLDEILSADMVLVVKC